MQELSIEMEYSSYKEVFDDSNKIEVQVNFETVTFPLALINLFIYNQKYFRVFKKALFDRLNVSLIVRQNDAIIIKKDYSPVSILMGINQQAEGLPAKFKDELSTLINKIDFRKFINKNKNEVFTLKLDNNLESMSYGSLTKIILDRKDFEEFLNEPKDLALKHIYLLKNFILKENIFIAYSLPQKSLEYYNYLIDNYDTDAFNKNVNTSFKYSSKFEIKPSFLSYIFNFKQKDKVKTAIYLYLNLITTLKYDYEYLEDVDTIKKHKDFSRLNEIDEVNNRVATYEFSCLLAKVFEKINLSFDYNDKYLILRIENLILKMNSISAKFNNDLLDIISLLKGIEILNTNPKTCKEFSNKLDSIIEVINSKKYNNQLLKMPFSDLKDIYILNSSKGKIDFNKKYEIFYKLISEAGEINAIGYILELKNILFSKGEIKSNIAFALVNDSKSKSNPVMIITVNEININLYNSNKYIYYNPNEVKEYTLNELRLLFFNGRLSYLKNSKDSIIGIEKSSV